MNNVFTRDSNRIVLAGLDIIKLALSADGGERDGERRAELGAELGV